MGKMRLALVNGNISLFKELIVVNQYENYDYKSYLIQKYVTYIFKIINRNADLYIWFARMGE